MRRNNTMKIENGKIIEATENELFDIYLEGQWDNIYSFNKYVELCEKAGTKIIKKESKDV